MKYCSAPPSTSLSTTSTPTATSPMDTRSGETRSPYILRINSVDNKVFASYTLGETHGSESESIRATADLWRRNVSALIGPQETCVHEARMAASFNLPMISHFCAHYGTSDKVRKVLLRVRFKLLM